MSQYMNEAIIHPETLPEATCLVYDGETTMHFLTKIITLSNHMGAERASRFSTILKVIDENDEIIAAFYVDKGHQNGAEIHFVTSSAIIIIVNRDKFIRDYSHHTGHSLITMKLARPGQLRQLYKSDPIPYDTYQKAQMYQQTGLNNR